MTASHLTHSYLTQLLFGQWLPRLGNVLLQSILVLCVAFGALELLRRASAAARHLIAVTAQVILLILPFAAFVLPGRAVSPVRQTGAASVGQSGLQSIRPNALTSHSGTAGRTQIGGTEADRSAVQPSRQIAADTSEPSLHSRDDRKTGTIAAVSAILPTRMAVGMAWAAWTVWMAGTLGMLARFGLGMWRLHGMAQSCQTVSDTSLIARLNDLQAEAGLTRRVRIVQSASPDSPFAPLVAMTWGAWHPVLLLPTSADDWSGERLRAVVLHELAHVRRNDWLTQTLGQIVCAVYWFHPLVWRLHGQAQLTAEHACDDAVLRGGMRGSEYAAHLLDVARAMQAGRAPLAGAVSMARVFQVQPRVEAILCPRCRREEARRPALIAAFAVAGLVLYAANRVSPLAAVGTPEKMPAPVSVIPVKAPAVAERRAPTRAEIAAAPGLPAYQHTYACGLTIELTAVYGGSGAAKRWWRPDGGSLPDALKSQHIENCMIDWPEKNWPQEKPACMFLVRSSGPFKQTYSAADQVTPVDFWPQIMHNIAEKSAYDDYSYGGINRAFRAGTRQCMVRYGVAAGPWRTVGVVRMPTQVQRGSSDHKPLENDINLALGSRSYLYYRDLHGRLQTMDFMKQGGHINDNMARRFVAVDGNGTLFPLLSPSASGEDEIFELNFRRPDNDIPNLAHIREFRLQTRPYEWAEFRNVQLQPKGGR